MTHMDELLLRRAQRGDSAAFEQLVTPLETLLWRICWRYTRHREDAADCLQETMVKAWRQLPNFRGDGELEAWLCRICTTCCLDYLRSRSHREADSIDAMKETGFDPRDTAPQPHEAAEQKDEREALARAIGELPDDMRQALVLSQLEGRSYEEVAAVTGVSIGTVKSRINRARQKLLQHMTRFREQTPETIVHKGERRASR